MDLQPRWSRLYDTKCPIGTVKPWAVGCLDVPAMDAQALSIFMSECKLSDLANPKALGWKEYAAVATNTNTNKTLLTIIIDIQQTQ